jgi:putative membrane protein
MCDKSLFLNTGQAQMTLMNADLISFEYFYRYVMYLLGGLVLLLGFAVIYVKTTPYDEIALIKAGHTAAAISLGGAMIGFALTLASSAVFHSSFIGFVGWAIAAMVVQLIGYAAMSRLMPNLHEALEANNTAVGGLLGAVSLSIGILNAACLS